MTKLNKPKLIGVDMRVEIRHDITNKKLWVFEAYYADIVDGQKIFRPYPNFVSSRYRSKSSCLKAISDFKTKGVSGVSWNDESNCYHCDNEVRAWDRELNKYKHTEYIDIDSDSEYKGGGNYNLKTEKSVDKKPKFVTCWHCGNTEQKILSYDSVFKCDKCKESLWTGEGGYE